MKDQPPERDRRGEQSLRRFEANLVMVLTTTLVAMYLLFEKSAESLQHVSAVGDLVPVPVNGLLAFVAIFGVVWLNFLFVRCETSLDMLKPLHFKNLREASPVKAAQLQKLLDRRSRYVAACNLGSQIARLMLVVISFLLAPGLAQFLSERLNLQYNYGALILSAILIMIPVGLFNLVVGELVPKSLGALYPERVVRAYRFVRVFGVIFLPLANLSMWVANVFTTRFGAKATFDVAHQAEEEIKTLVESAQESGAIEDDEKELLHSVFEFTDTVARQIMTPRTDLDAVSIHSDPAEIIALIQGSGHSRIPIYEDTDDQIIGIIHAKDLLLATLEKKDRVDLRSLLRPALFVTENKNLHELLAEMKAARSQLAIVQDEFGGTAGIVTMEDIIEELVGDIQDEYDVEEPYILEEDGYYIVDGKTQLDDLNAIVGSEIDSEVFDTVGGYVFGLFGRQPKEGESIIEDGYRFTVLETDGRRIVRLRVEQATDHSPTGLDDEEPASRAANG